MMSRFDWWKVMPAAAFLSILLGPGVEAWQGTWQPDQLEQLVIIGFALLFFAEQVIDG